MESLNVKRLHKSPTDWTRYKMGIVKYPNHETYCRIMRERFNSAFKRYTDKYSTSIEDLNFFQSCDGQGFFNLKNFYPVIMVIADTDQYGSFWHNRKDVKDLVMVNGEITGRIKDKIILGSSDHYGNGNFLAHFKRHRLKYQYHSIFVPNEIQSKEAIIRYYQSEIDFCKLIERDMAKFDAGGSYLAGKFSGDRVKFYFEINAYMHYVGKLFDLLCKFRK